MDWPKSIPPDVPDGVFDIDGLIPDGMPWLAEGARLLHSEVAPRDGDVSRLLRIARTLDRFLPFDVAWCGLFAYHCLRFAFPKTRVPWLPMRARPWLRYGVETTPQVGALMVFWLSGPKSQLGHVGFYLSEDDISYHVLGGNQHNRIRVQRVGKSRLLGTRWPAEAGPPPGLRRSLNLEGSAPFEFQEIEAIPQNGTDQG